MKLPISTLLIILFFAGCRNAGRVPAHVLQPLKMQTVMWDMFQAQSLAQQRANKDSATTVAIETKKLSDEVFKIHGINEKKFAESYQWYLQHPSVLNQILDSIYSQKSDENKPIPDRPALDQPELKDQRLKRPSEPIQ